MDKPQSGNFTMRKRVSVSCSGVRVPSPQRVVKQHGEAVVIVPAEDFDRAVEKSRQPNSLLEFFQSAPTGGQGLDLKRKRDKTRKIKW